MSHVAVSVKPIADRVLVRRAEADDVTPGGIVLPDAAKDKPCHGVVVAVGPGRMLDDGTRGSMELKKGDTVTFNSYGGTDVEIDGEPFVIMREADILFVE